MTVAKFKYAASATTVISLAASLASAANTHSGHSGITQTELDNSTDSYLDARFTLNIPETFAAAPTAGGTFDVYMTLNDVDGTTDESPVPGATDIVNNAQYVTSFVIDNQDVATVKSKIVRGALYGVEKANFYLVNNSGQATTYTATPLTLKVQPLTVESA